MLTPMERFGTLASGQVPDRVPIVCDLEGAYLLLREEYSYLLALHTPCSGDFTAEAERIAQETGLPLRWERSTLDRLEAALIPLFEDQ